MATEKQIRANRVNAKRSTGPKSLAGRIKSSRNALRHGLSIPAANGPPAGTQAYGLAELLTPVGASQLHRLAALEMAQAQAQLLRVAAARKTLLATLDLQSPSHEQVRRLAALERYERRAHRQRRRAAGLLRGTEPMDVGVEGASAKVGKTNPI
ncbi:hypothetical protein QCM80_30625 [Bradyrhizobium sp. SSUT112]|uniref:hypothetical protein n=1 Tax=Bradyrhizobium sp. SSUT112 TaxID=3040604 RepID=UPI00244CC488|nr:hypothetical protein [Bradyrhizobium sp. SSUT112]MDH2354989.1 hypothetical protein [Bradyrhizobium sp. SSUT112]